MVLASGISLIVVVSSTEVSSATEMLVVSVVDVIVMAEVLSVVLVVVVGSIVTSVEVLAV